ncbi:MAG: hypothetical protein KGI35_20675, partial [Burkholderiales bacterium]|nr:hypothetical protein [Burkholderiales bacterium]
SRTAGGGGGGGGGAGRGSGRGGGRGAGGATAGGAATWGTADQSSALMASGSRKCQPTENTSAATSPACTSSESRAPGSIPPGR